VTGEQCQETRSESFEESDPEPEGQETRDDFLKREEDELSLCLEDPDKPRKIRRSRTTFTTFQVTIATRRKP
jgi:hypothetical protein